MPWIARLGKWLPIVDRDKWLAFSTSFITKARGHNQQFDWSILSEILQIGICTHWKIGHRLGTERQSKFAKDLDYVWVFRFASHWSHEGSALGSTNHVLYLYICSCTKSTNQIQRHYVRLSYTTAGGEQYLSWSFGNGQQSLRHHWFL